MTSPWYACARRGAPRKLGIVKVGIMTAALTLTGLALSGCTGSGSTGPGRSDAVVSSAGAPAPTDGSGPVLPPPSPPADHHFEANGDTAEALAAMPGLYGLPLLHTLMRDDRIEIAATGDCPTVLEVLQSGQWAVEVVPDTDPQAGQVRGPDDDATHLARLRLADQTSFVRLTETPGTCTGSIILPGS